MNSKIKDFDRVRQAFNNLKILKGQYTNIATSDSDGNPNVAPIGSMRIVDENTVHVLQGFLPKTLANLRKNPKATFSTCIIPSLLDRLTPFQEKEKDILGYQVYCTFKGESDNRADVLREVDALSSRVPFFAKGAFKKFCDKNLKRLLMFEVNNVRAIGAPE